MGWFLGLGGGGLGRNKKRGGVKGKKRGIKSGTRGSNGGDNKKVTKKEQTKKKKPGGKKKEKGWVRAEQRLPTRKILLKKNRKQRGIQVEQNKHHKKGPQKMAKGLGGKPGNKKKNLRGVNRNRKRN